MPAPTIDPRERRDVPPADSYGRGARVWVHRAGEGWRHGLIESASPVAAMVTYRPTDHRGTGVDTVTADRLAPRPDDDVMDRPLLVRPRAAHHDQADNPPTGGDLR